MSKIKSHNLHNKKDRSKNITKPEVSDLKIQQNNLPSNYFYRNLIIIICIIISVFFIQKEINYLKIDVHWGDEILNMLTVKNIATTGLPVYGTYANTVTSPLYSNDALTVTYWEYAVELYLRTPVFLMTKLFDFKWEYYSSLLYLYLIFIILIIYYLKNKELNFETKLPFTTIAFLILIFSISKFASSQFHYVRYYPFTVMIIPLIHILSNMVFIYSNLSQWKKYFLVLALAFIPGLFHLVNFSYLFFWFFFLFFYSIYNNLKKQNKKETFNKIIGKNYKFVLFGIIFTILLGILVNYLVPTLKSCFYFSSENIKVISIFLSFYFNKKFAAFNSIFIILLIFSIINFKKFNKIESNIFYTSFGYILFCLIGFSISGGQIVISNPYSYMLFMFPVILIIISLMLTLLFRQINRFIPIFYLKEFIIFFVIAFVFILINLKKFEEYENRSHGTREVLEKLLEVKNTYKNCVFVTSQSAHYFYNYLPDNKAYLYRPYKEIKTTNIIKDDFYKSSSGYVKNIGGEIYVGTPESFCRMLHENENNVIYFQYILQELNDKFKNIYTGNPVSAKYLIAMLCGKNDFEKTQNALKTIKESGLFEEEYVSLGSYLFNQNLFNDCIYSSLKALSMNPKNIRALINLGISYFKLGKFEESIKMYNKALSIDPNSSYLQTYFQITGGKQSLAK